MKIQNFKAADGNNFIWGDNFPALEFEMLDESDDPIDLSNVKIRIQFRQDSKTGDLCKEIDETDGIDIHTPVMGIWMIETFKIDKTNFKPGVIYYDVQFVWTDNSDETPFGGTMVVEQDTTD
jgi:hypothetical protein